MLIWIIIAGAIGWMVVSGMKANKQRRLENETFAGKHKGWDVYGSAYDRSVIAIEHDRQLITVGSVTNHQTLPWRAIGSVEIERNGQSISQTNRGSQVMGAAVGAVLLGPMGLLLGGLTGSKRQKERVNKLALKITLDDRENPIRRTVFFNMSGSGLDANAAQLKAPIEKLEHFHALLLSAIRASTAQSAALSVREPTIGKSRAEAIADLWKLVECGALTKDEFETEKRTLLSSVDARPALEG